uniref:Uncharacterized protein n=1 Tax=Entomoneis paludosa TaxID=265537 RepID=A0A7S2YFF1_9STRA|mmetsp:Transcript_30447/g.63580  ORF Transcript_30447/g.63580 Transcript_30447/m.63580 type:complete len:162 (+) Transcript_30447:739-1224(+)|eukprot:CAMPEP_0172443538 /NCGR_PEP_ID=MMETSP1065-20121228/3779_1 /TAXON_ID=265537 /ORGANISM="Amphiprora paludosa, Strain CCMP125" /LENGTH=161 /DNA_ID=CAMNT_0013193805 /DNA_START=737 /DNA_END=1222 /DNA_ORIENTATION=+
MASTRIHRTVLAALLALLSFGSVQAWTAPSPKNTRPSTTRIQYAPTNLPTSETPSITAQKMLKDGVVSLADRKRTSPVTLSQSVLASSDTLPSFPTSHGLLSPETVMRMEELAREGGYQESQALVSFFRTYKRHGPMSCLPMLSDPDILPHLTNAMRDCMA